jgi:predicted transcriptional regulator
VNSEYVDERILSMLCDAPSSSRQIAGELDLIQRSVRRRLRRLIIAGYVFSPERGVYRITASGFRVMEPVPRRRTMRRRG